MAERPFDPDLEPTPEGMPKAELILTFPLPPDWRWSTHLTLNSTPVDPTQVRGMDEILATVRAALVGALEYLDDGSMEAAINQILDANA